MATISRITEVRLLSVPLENDYKHTLFFETPEAQTQYFISKQRFAILDSSYQRKDSTITFPESYDKLLACNYVMYKNPAYENGNKWFYAFITNMEYLGDELTRLTIETDVMQTWLFDYRILPSFIEREHVKYDDIGLHTVPEGLETGPYAVKTINTYNKMLDTAIIIGSTVNFNDPDFKFWDGDEIKKYNIDTGDTYGNVFSGVTYYIVTTEQAQKLISSLANTGQSDAIVSMFMAPKCMLERDENYNSQTKPYETVKPSTKAIHIPWATEKNTDGTIKESVNYKPKDIDGYIPKNNKLFTYPYTYLLMSNNSGGSAIYKYEEFKYSPDYCNFEIFGTVSPGMSIKLVPYAYNGDYASLDGSHVFNFEEGLNLGKFPICSWANDVYTNWLTQNSVNNTVAYVAGGLMTVVGIAAAIPTGGASAAAATSATAATISTVAGAGTAIGGAATIGSTIGQKYAHSFQPPQAEGNTNSGDVTFASGNLTFTAYTMNIKREYAKIIDDYFTMFGYKIDKLAIPLENHRSRFWYTKTVDANIDGAIPVMDIQKIKNCYNFGITFWKDTEHVGDYFYNNLPNEII